jgi:hypothetical protein
MRQKGVEELSRTIRAMDALAERVALDEAALVTGLRAIYTGLLVEDFAEYDLDEVGEAARSISEGLFRAQLRLRGRIPEWSRRQLMTRPVQSVLRDVLRSVRYGRDLLGEIHLRHPRLPPGGVPCEAFGGPEDFLDVNPDFARAPLELEPGDVVLQRGTANNSAAIARIGDVDSQYSHLAIVAEDGDGRPVMVEALIEDGSILTPMQTALAHGVGRAVLFRHRDRELARWASILVRDHVVRSDGRRGPRILYDFSMQLEGYDGLYCAKLVRLAYSMASSGAYRLPTYPTLLDMRNRDFIERIGVTALETFAPGDMELEPAFDVVAEWADYRLTSELRLKDMIMTKLFEWMETQDFRFRPTLLVGLVGLGGRIMSRLPDGLQERLRHRLGKVPPNMSARAIGAVAMLHKTAEQLYAHVRRKEEETIRATGRPLHPRQVQQELEALKSQLGSRIGYLVREAG